MLFLALSVACSVLLGFIFKLFGRYRIDILQAIVFNYFVCVACGWIYLGQFPVGPAPGERADWTPFALGLGLVFISGFNTAAQTVRFYGVTVSQVMQKMSILATVPFAIFVIGEPSNAWKWAGFVLALAAIVLVNIRRSDLHSESKNDIGHLWIPIITWVLAAIIELVFLWVNHQKMLPEGDARFITTVFGTAGALGLLIAAWGWATRRNPFQWRYLAAGIVLGVPNFGSMYFLLRALGVGLDGSLVFPLTNVSIIVATTIGAVALFKERLTAVNWIGIALSALSIILMTLL